MRAVPAAAAPWRRDLQVAVLALGALLLWEFSRLDLAAARLFGSAAGFAWRDHWLTARVLHDGGRLLGWTLLALMAVDAWRPLRPGPARSERLAALGATLACLLLVPLLKRYSLTSCPWDLAEFGGVAAYVPHWLPGPGDGGGGHCFPSGHAVAAFAFFSLYFLWRPHRPHAARRLLGGVLVAGALFGLAQLVRGAHYPSHTLWSAWLCWCVAALAARWTPARAARLQPA